MRIAIIANFSDQGNATSKKTSGTFKTKKIRRNYKIFKEK